ncbi:PucR C-terminal helix-turn-helix domain-containing protein [Geodermatophilus dictyosporus]|uniref:PucR C-terminal helix-turn-helix domain-containing protein n=1 Tax=Geodermatophilus dictyosporus TaxID=1523247 RepID=A0A1I5RP99_9ACTN|nr:helix-turn-helix domain-containing protein [Geodermatophilus dictyosporus]SFP60071.1 PucR C-terminal helix-turn-helix domain-containing protein [Geodermatophilus dictyosporus]
MRTDLQDVVDEAARLLQAPATLEDVDFTLVAFCAHPTDDDGDDGGAMDAVRARSILGRGSTPATRRWFEDLGIARAQGPVRTPADPAAGVLTRLLLPVRADGRLLGYLWLLDGGRTDPDDAGDPALAAAVALAARAGRLLAEREADDDPGAALAAVLTGTGAERDRAAAALAARPGPVALVALRPPRGAPAGRRPTAGAAVLPGGEVAVLVRLASPADLRPAAAAASAALARLPAGTSAGVSAAGPGAADLPARWAEARAAAAVAGLVPRLAPVAQWAELGGWRTAAALPAPDPAVAPLLAEPALATTAGAYLDAAGSVARTAAALGIHRQTLYYRLGRITALTGLDLADGDTRLLVHASLRRARLP